MAHYVMSDIHGEADRFHAMLEKIQFSPDDTLYILGDVIDRGPDGIPLLREIMDSMKVIPTQSVGWLWVIFSCIL